MRSTVYDGTAVSEEKQMGWGKGFRVFSMLRSRRKMLALSLIIIILFSTAIYFLASFVARPSVIGILKVEGALLTGDQAALYSQAIMEAMLNDSIRGIVLKVDSPGGYADLVEQVYLDLLELKARKPLVASITMALSGGYYISVASDYIYAHPSATVGNIGVIGIGPPILVPSETVLESGVHKATGFSRLLFSFNMSRVLENFVKAVELGRGSRLRLPPNVLRRGSIYMGSEALEAGLVDELGSVESALKRVAQAAGVTKYSVVDLVESVKSRFKAWTSLEEQAPWANLTVDKLKELHPPPSIYYLYLPTNASLYSSSAAAQNFGEWAGVDGESLVLVDMSHGNMVTYWDLEVLARELMLRNATISLATSWSMLESKLGSAEGVLIAAPTLPYSEEQVERLRSFVESGKTLVIMYDPAEEYVKIPDLTWPVNSLSMGFGIFFNSGYLYDENQFFGMYRNIYVEGFSNHTLTLNISRIVLFTSTGICSTGKDVAWTSNTTFSSVSEKAKTYGVISVVELKGTVIAIGDITFMQEPYCYVEDNHRLVQNLALMLTGGGK
ncbi:MAG: S49 family peptidase [Candidatus Brockarchaeota archaeon]|nr:S49 family peptidase [Candidatus Brockarchaeota archaeon]